jgi:hypothetical protein
MQPLKITIFGEFWDCQIYRGRLYLFDFEGKLTVYDWNQVIEKIEIEEINKLAFECAFLRSSYLYGYNEIFNDSEFKAVLLNKFERLENRVIEISAEDFKKCIIGEMDNPFDSLPIDTEISANQLYSITDSGLWSSTAHRAKSEKYPLSSRPKKLFDAKLLSLSANRYASIAISGGSDGLFQYSKKDEEINEMNFLYRGRSVEKEINQLSEKHSLFSDWSNLSIFSSSDISESYMSLFKWAGSEQEGFFRKREGIIEAHSIFKESKSNNELVWGGGNKVYKASGNRLLLSRFNNYANEQNGESLFGDIETIQLKKEIKAATESKVCLFGTIIETDYGLLVLGSDGSLHEINEIPIRWRIYPRSIDFENHLHVIYDNRLDVYSFNHDYFIDQYVKQLGLIKK